MPGRLLRSRAGAHTEFELHLRFTLADVLEGIHEHPQVCEIVRDLRLQELLVLLHFQNDALQIRLGLTGKKQ